MKSIFENRLFCTIMSLACAWFMYQDLIEYSKINILNLIYLVGFTFLTFHKNKKVATTTENHFTNTKTSEKKSLELNPEDELQLTNTFKKS